MDEMPRGTDETAVAEAAIATARKFLDDLAERIPLADAEKTGRRPTGRAPPMEQTDETGTRNEETNAGADFPAVDTPEWGRMNQRRAELIRKKNRKGLSPDEQV